MGTTDGLNRGIKAVNTGDPIKVPVGEKTFGRIMNVLGHPIDDEGPIGAEDIGQFIARHQVMRNRPVVRNY